MMADNEWQAIHGMGQGVVDSLYDALYAAYQAGKPGIAGNADPVIQVALAVGPGLSREQFVQIVREADKAKEGKVGQEFQQAMHGVVAKWKQSLAADVERQRSEVAAFQGSSKHAASPSSGQWQKPAGAKTTQFAKASGGSAPVTALGNTAENTGGVATDPAVAHHNPTSTPPVTASPTSAQALSSTLGRPADDDAEPGRQPDGTVPQDSSPKQPQAAPAIAKPQSAGTGGISKAQSPWGMLGGFLMGLAYDAGVTPGPFLKPSGGFTSHFPGQGDARERGPNGRFLPGGMASVLGSGGMSGMSELLGGSGGSAGSSGTDSQALLLQAIEKLTEAVEKLTKVMQAPASEPGPQPDGSFVPSLGQQPQAQPAAPGTQGSMTGSTQGSSSGDMRSDVVNTLMRMAMAAASRGAT